MGLSLNLVIHFTIRMILVKSMSSTVARTVTVHIYTQYQLNVRRYIVTSVKSKSTTEQATAVGIHIYVNQYALELFQIAVPMEQWSSVTCSNAMTVVPDMNAFQIALIMCAEMPQAVH